MHVHNRHGHHVLDVDATVVGRENLDRNVGCQGRQLQLLVAQRAQPLVRYIGDVRNEGAPNFSRRRHAKSPLRANLAAIGCPRT